MRYRLVIPALVVVAMVQLSAQSAAESPAAVVRRLYTDFAWEANPHLPQGKQTFEWQSREVLQAYLDSSLTALMLRDQECVTKSQSECALGFSTIWDSQDSEGAQASVRETADSATVVVNLHYPNPNYAPVVTYHLIRTPAGWRIHDISYKSARSLRQLLQADP